MDLLEGMKKNNTITNTKGSQYYISTYDSNLDLFSMLSRYDEEDKILKMFNNAYSDNKELALANLLYILDIRGGRGERRIFKIIFKDLCMRHAEDALRILPYIGELGRYDYVLEGIGTPIEENVIGLIKEQLASDMENDNPSLLAKWLPSHRTHKVNNNIAKLLMKKLGMSEKEYRVMLASLRKKINIVEKNLTEKNYDNIDFSMVPTKAMMKYTEAYQKRMPEKYKEYKEQVKEGKAKINTNGLFVYEIIRKVYFDRSENTEIYDLMWKNQKDVLKGCKTNVLVMADTSGSMLSYGGIPYATAIGLALYTAERNSGIFKNHFMTFSNQPYLCEVKGETICDKVKNIPRFFVNTDIDKAFELLLNTAKENNLKQKDLPSHLLIISDMEFDNGVYAKDGTNFNGWKKAFKEAGYKLPIVIFWNVAGNTQGIPVPKYENDVAMISGFSTNVLENILTLEEYVPYDVMLEKLAIYLEMLRG